MILGFKPQFKEPILAGTKIHTIREDAHDRWKLGMMIQMATGVRTKYYECFMDGQCTGTQRIFMSFDHMLHVSIDGGDGNFGFEELYYPEKTILAINDGFETVEAFEAWFRDVCLSKKDKCFSGKIIHWTDFKY